MGRPHLSPQRLVFFLFDKTTPLVQFKEQHAWIDALNIHYFLGIDGISVLFVLLTALLTVLCVMVSWEAIQDRAKEFYIALLTLEGAMMGIYSDRRASCRERV